MPGLNLDSCNGDITIAYKYTMAVQETELEEEEGKLIVDYLQNEVFAYCFHWSFQEFLPY